MNYNLEDIISPTNELRITVENDALEKINTWLNCPRYKRLSDGDLTKKFVAIINEYMLSYRIQQHAPLVHIESIPISTKMS
jgi:hypothetical protein